LDPNDEGGVVDDSGIEAESDLVDLADLLLGELPSLDDAPLAHSIRRILEESREGGPTVVSGHESSI
jgi:FXSXX-COOH protein